MSTQLPEVPQTEVNIRDYLDILRRRKAIMVQTFVVVLAVGIITTLLAKPVYESSAKLVVQASNPSLNIIQTSNALAGVGVAAPDSVPTQVEILQSGPFLREAIRAAGTPANNDTTDQSIRVSIVDNTNVLRVTVQSHDAQYAQKLADAILQLHNANTSRDSTRQIRTALDFVTERAKDAKNALDGTEKELSAFKMKYRTDDLQKRQEADKQKYLELQSKLREVTMTERLAKARLEQYKTQLRVTLPVVTTQTQRVNPRHEILSQRLLLAQEKLEDLRMQFHPESSQIKDAAATVANLESRLDPKTTPIILVENSPRPNPLYDSLVQQITSAENEVRLLESQLAAVTSDVQMYATSVSPIADWEVKLRKLERDREIEERQWQDLSARQADLEIRQKAQPIQHRIIETANLPSEPVRPKKATNILLSIALAVCLGLAMAFLQEYMDDRINSPEDADRAAHLPLLGHVPMIPEKEPTVVTNLPARSHVAEAYRTLRSSIGFAAVDGVLNTMMVTSPSKGEGKTVTSLNLAIAMALDGKSVILVDADLRRPSVHKHLRLPQGPGLTDVLVGQKSPDDVLNQTEVAGLRVMTAGPIPPNPAELLNSQPMDRIIETLRDMADVVVFDTAPCIPVSDSIVLSSKVDGVVVVIHAGETKKAAVKHTRDLLDRARARTLGLVFNKVPQRKGGYYYYYYYYYGGYYEDGPGEGGRGARRKSRKRGGNASDRSAAMVRADEELGPHAARESRQEED